VLFVALFIIPGLDRRFSWSPPYSWAWKAAANALVAAGFLIMFLAFRANSYAAGVVEIAPGQQVIATGPYARVRHPMYFGAVLMFLVTPVALGSFWALAPAAGLVAAIVARLRDEERFLSAHLSGYSSYRQQVPFRLIPGIW
jgi:protein-S-isoprenylcysteine O-methyltransferase Ste14